MAKYFFKFCLSGLKAPKSGHTGGGGFLSRLVLASERLDVWPTAWRNKLSKLKMNKSHIKHIGQKLRSILGETNECVEPMWDG